MISKRQLYALGEPLGDGATRTKPGGRVLGGGGDSSSSQSTSNYDQRVAVQDGIGLAASHHNVINVTDGGIVKEALNAVNISTAVNGDGFTKLLDVTQNIFNRSEALIGQTQKSVADAYSQAQTDAKGTIDNRTIMVIAVVGMAAFAYATKKG
jgi:hypothetical protein